MVNKKMIFAVAALSAALVTGSSAIVFAEEATESDDYSCTEGQQQYEERHKKFLKVPEFDTEEEREAYFAEQGIERKIKPCDTSDEEADGSSGPIRKKGGRRRSLNEYDGKSAEEKLANGEITQEMYDAIKEKAEKKHDEIRERFAE